VSASRELAREPQCLSLAAAPPALRVDVQHSKLHAPQLPWSRRDAQGEPAIQRASTPR
jgi:hypothetical protein